MARKLLVKYRLFTGWQCELSWKGCSPRSVQFSSVQLLSHVQLFVTPWTAAHQASLSITNSWSLIKLMSSKSMKPSNRLILYHPLLFLPSGSIFPSIRVFSNESVLHIRLPKYWSFSFSISPVNEYSGLISFRMDWLDPLAVQGTLKSLLQHHNSQASILWHSAFFTVQLSHPHMTTGKTIALTRWTISPGTAYLFLGATVSLLGNGEKAALGKTEKPLGFQVGYSRHIRKVKTINFLTKNFRTNL